MSFKKIILFTLCSFTFSTIGFSQDTPQDIVDTFFETYQQEDIGQAIDYIFSTNPWMSKSEDVVTTLKHQITGQLSEDMVGKYHGHEVITTKTIGDTVTYVTYMVKYDRQPIRFTFIFYKPDGEWRVYKFSYKDGLDDELEESGKVYRLPENL